MLYSMKKTLFLALALLLGIGNFAYASSPMACVSMPMPSMSMGHACCKPADCRCRLEKGQPEIVFAQIASQEGKTFEASIISRIEVKSFTLESTHSDLIFSALKSPPKDKVYDLYSQYRI